MQTMHRICWVKSALWKNRIEVAPRVLWICLPLKRDSLWARKFAQAMSRKLMLQ